MIELTTKADNYAAEKTNELMTKAIAQAYADGYRDGYKDREEEIPVDLRDNKTEYVDLGLPSGTLWAKDYEKRENDVVYLPYCKATTMNLPTMEQWEELYELCRWECKTYHGWESEKNIQNVLCVGPNGNVLKFEATGMYKVTDERCNVGDILFWLKNNEEDSEKDSVYINRSLSYRNSNTDFYKTNYVTNTFFLGYKLPVRLVRSK